MTTTTLSFGQTVSGGAKIMLGLTDMLLDGITQDTFGKKPEGVDCNSPAFIFGHLAIYPDMVIQMLGGDAKIDEKYEALFKHGVDCVDDPNNETYPPMDEIVDRFKTRFTAALEALEKADTEAINKENPMESMRDRFPTVGGISEFLLNGHTAFHLGQLSTWRRCMGLGHAM